MGSLIVPVQPGLFPSRRSLASLYQLPSHSSWEAIERKRQKVLEWLCLCATGNAEGVAEREDFLRRFTLPAELTFDQIADEFAPDFARRTLRPEGTS